MVPPRSSSGAQPDAMSHNKTKSIINSFIIVPLLTTAISMNAFTASINTALVAQNQEQTQTLSPEEIAKQKDRTEKAAKIDAYYAKNNMPLKGYGMKMVLVAEKNNLDPYLLPAISVREQTGGKVLPYNCPGKTKNHNTFGWASGRICFTSFDEAIETVGMKLNTLSFYKGKTTQAKLKTYNPDSVVNGYSVQVMNIMKTIESTTI